MLKSPAFNVLLVMSLFFLTTTTCNITNLSNPIHDEPEAVFLLNYVSVHKEIVGDIIPDNMVPTGDDFNFYTINESTVSVRSAQFAINDSLKAVVGYDWHEDAKYTPGGWFHDYYGVYGTPATMSYGMTPDSAFEITGIDNGTVTFIKDAKPYSLAPGESAMLTWERIATHNGTKNGTPVTYSLKYTYTDNMTNFGKRHFLIEFPSMM